MIRKSAFVAVLAILLSVGAHLFGLMFSTADLPRQSSEQRRSNSVELATTFEDFADPAPQPVEPEPEVEPEPPVEPPPEPESAEVPTSDAKVASPDPQQVFAPDTGASAIIRPNTPEPEVTESVDPSEDSTPSNAEAPQTVEPVQPATETAESTEPVEAPSPEPPLSPAPTEEATTAVEESDLAVTASIRPRLPEERPLQPQDNAEEEFDEFAIFRNPQRTVVSPLAQYRQDGTDAFSSRNRASRSGGRGPGNANETNYAGEVLVHLNRAPLVYVASKGFAQVFFEINPDGSLAWVDVVDSSGSPDIDRAAKDQVRSAAPFPRPPGGVSRKLSFFYQIN